MAVAAALLFVLALAALVASFVWLMVDVGRQSRDLDARHRLERLERLGRSLRAANESLWEVVRTMAGLRKQMREASGSIRRFRDSGRFLR